MLIKIRKYLGLDVKSDNQRRKECNERKKAKGLYRPSIWVHESWKGTEALEKLKKRLGKERMK